MVVLSVSLSVGPLVTFVSTAKKTTELIEMPFAELTLLGPKNHVLDWGPDPPVRRGILRGCPPH